MPYIHPSSYHTPFWLRNPHYQTIYHSEFRRVTGITYLREQIETADGDFLNLDWVKNNQPRAAIVVHGLESSSHRAYLKGMVKAISKRGFDCAAMNLRSCGGEMNRTNVFYNAGKIDDLDEVVSHLETLGYSEIVLCGFSLGGNLVLKYVTEKGAQISRTISHAAAVSAPINLKSSSDALEEHKNLFYNRRFVKKLCRKITQKALLHPGSVSVEKLAQVKTLRDYDEHYTAPMFGYQNANDYYLQASSYAQLHQIAIPTLLINAQDDPFLGDGCFPITEATSHPLFYFEMTDFGGHIGFLTPKSDEYWHETRVAEFLAGKKL